MLISEVSKECKLTKKAIGYYEEKGLLEARFGSNGYRVYDEKDVQLLKEIFVLKQLGMGIADMKLILHSTDKRAALQDYVVKQKYKIGQLQAQQDALQQMLDQERSIEESFEDMESKLDEHRSIKEKLLLAFPGVYGKYLYVHFGRFLEGKMDSIEKIKAFHNIVEYLDQLSTRELFTGDLESDVQELYDSLSLSQGIIEKIDEEMDAALSDYEAFKNRNRGVIERYIALRSSAEYKSGPAFKIQQMLQSFQRNNGYSDIFIPNMLILSDSYKRYYDNLLDVNQRFVLDFPELGSKSTRNPH